LKGVDFILTLGVLFAASLVLHEYGHMITIRLLGGKGVIESTVLSGVRLIVPPPQKYGNILVAFMGGWFSGLIYLVLWMLSEDPEDKVARFSVFTYQLIYGSFEGVWFATNIDVLLLVGVIVGVVVMFLTMLTALLRRGVVFRFVTRQKTS